MTKIYNFIKERLKWFLVGGVALGAGVGIADSKIDPYTTTTDKFEAVQVEQVPEEGENKVELMKLEPEIVLNKWNGEVALSVKREGTFTEANRKFLTDEVEWTNSKEDVLAYPTPNGFEFEIVLKEKPLTNIFNFTISGAENLDFFYQPPLTQQEIDEGAFRPNNVIGSYAVYHKTKANHRVGSTNYATGKAFHIYRPKVIDASGAEVWADLNIDGGLLTVTVPQKFLDEAVYPVRVDPTFGITSLGATKSINQSTTAVQRRGDTPEAVSGTLDSITVALAMEVGASNSSRLFYFYVNDVNSGGADLHGQIAKYSNTFSLTQTATWFTMTAASESLDGGSYEVNAHPANFAPFSSEESVWLQDTVAAHNVYSENFTVEATAQEDPWSNALLSSTLKRSIYATYTASGGATPKSTISDIIIFE